MNLKKELLKLLKTKNGIRLRHISDLSGICISTIWMYANKPDRDISFTYYEKLTKAVELLKRVKK